MRLLVLDTIHGGRDLAGYLREQGHFVDAVDVYRKGSVVDTVICQGKILMYNRYIPDEEKIIAGARESADDLLNRAGIMA